jgi:methylenetetrahydrofolate reductase (NADPH)
MKHSLKTSPAQGQLAERLRIEGLIIFAEVYPPNGVDGAAMVERYQPLHNVIDAVNIADSPMATPLMSGMAMAALFERTGMPTIVNMTCRDRNSIALQSDLLGAAALGIQSVFCVTGDPVALGDHPDARPVYECDALQLVAMAQQMRAEGIMESGRPLDTRPHYLIGAAGSLLRDSQPREAERTAAKVDAGADFIQTPAMFDISLLREFAARLDDLGTLHQAPLIAGVAVVTSAEQALWVQTEKPETLIPQQFIDTMIATPEPQRHAVGLSYAAELLNQIREIPGVRGILLYPYDSRPEDVEAMAELLETVGFV